MIACFTLPQIGLEVERARTPAIFGIPLGLTLPEGTLTTVSEEAVPFGIRAGHSASAARILCPGMRVLPYDRDAYEQAVQPSWDLYAGESSVVEPISPECCFVELAGPSILDRAQLLVRETAALVSIAVHAGLARTKFIARQAARHASIGQVVVIAPNREASFLAPLAVHSIPGLDKTLRQRLDIHGIHTLGDLQKLPLRELRAQFKQAGIRLHRLATGEDHEPVRPLWPRRFVEKALAFEDEIVDTRQIHEALRRCAETISRCLADRQEYCRALALWVTLANGRILHQHEKQSAPIHDLALLHGSSLRLLERMAIVQPVSGVHLQASDIDCASGRQLALFDLDNPGASLPHERTSALTATMTYLGKRYGSEAVLPARAYGKPRRISLWTDVLGRRINQPLQVTTDPLGTPVAFLWRGKEQQVERVLDRWREEEWCGNAERTRRTVYLVQTGAAPFSELIQSRDGWTLGNRFD